MICDEKWLASLKVGDEVGLTHWVYPPSIARVTRITKTLIIIGPNRFNRTSGRNTSRGSRIGLDRITPEVRDDIEHNELASELKSRRWKSDTLDTLRKVVAALPQPEPKEREA